MKPTDATDKIHKLWTAAAGRSVTELFGDILKMSDSHTDVVDRIIEAGGYDASVQPNPQTLDEISALAVEADDNHNGKAAESAGRWLPMLNSAPRFVLE